MLASNPLIQVTPGLMIWTIVCFLVVLFVLKRYAFGPIQQMIDTRRERIEQAIAEADNAREEARHLLEEHRKLIGQAKSESEEILAEARRVADAQRDRVRLRLGRPELDSRVKQDVLAQTAEGSDDRVVNFVKLLAEKGRAAEIPGVAAELDALVAAAQRSLDVELTTALALSDEAFGR